MKRKVTDLRLSLKTKWFEMTKTGIKTEDYREINEYWCNRLTTWKEGFRTIYDCVQQLKKGQEFVIEKRLNHCFLEPHFFPKTFETTILTLGYPSANDTDRIIQFEHGGIEIRTGNPEWGAEPNKLYFVIKHGKRIL
jgi:hypothetical protein